MVKGSRKTDLQGKEITIFTNFKFKDYPDMDPADIKFPGLKELVRKEFTRINKEIEDSKKKIDELEKAVG